MIIPLSSQTEALLRKPAGRLNQDADLLADTLLQSALEEAERDYEEAVEGIRRGLEAGAAGDEMPFRGVRRTGAREAPPA